MSTFDRIITKRYEEIRSHAIAEFLACHEAKTAASPFYVNTGPEHMPLGLADRRAHDQRLAERGERDES